MNYQETLSYLFSQLPMYQRIGKAAYKADLNNTLALDEYFNHPHKKYKTIHIAGTNGKGSTSHMIASVLMASGYKVGLYTSPHLKDFRERIRINGDMITEEYVIDFVEKHRLIFEKIKPSFFEMTVAMAFEYFANQEVDVAVIEVGLGGRLDSTNIISPILSIITNIGLDHTDLLGDTIEQIAAEKAGIIKENTPIIISQTQPEVIEVFIEKAQENDAPIIFADEQYYVELLNSTDPTKQEFRIENRENGEKTTVSLDLLGNYQGANLPGVLASFDLLYQEGFKINQSDIIKGLSNVIEKTGLLGRWQVLSQSPLTICDTGHNLDGISHIVTQISDTPHKNLHMVIGMVADKNIDGILSILPKNAKYYFTKASIPRALDQNELAKRAFEHGLNGISVPNVKDAIAEAKKNAESNDLIFIGGSTFIVADALILL
jgi:dihydrofolate synthase / folylpolyglutamate synthase